MCNNNNSHKLSMLQSNSHSSISKYKHSRLFSLCNNRYQHHSREPSQGVDKTKTVVKGDHSSKDEIKTEIIPVDGQNRQMAGGIKDYDHKLWLNLNI